MKYALWDMGTGNVVKAFATCDGAEAPVRELFEKGNVAYVSESGLIGLDADGEEVQLAEGLEIVQAGPQVPESSMLLPRI